MVHAKKPEVGDKVIYNLSNGEKMEGEITFADGWSILVDGDYNGSRYYGLGFIPYNTNEFHTDGTWNYA